MVFRVVPELLPLTNVSCIFSTRLSHGCQHNPSRFEFFHFHINNIHINYQLRRTPGKITLFWLLKFFLFPSAYQVFF